jgi:copper chaperone CopZ
MQKRFLKASFTEECNGCELCIMEVQRQLKKIGLEGSLIRVLGILEFRIDLDQQVNKLDIEKIKQICPKNVFTVEERANDDGLLE